MKIIRPVKLIDDVLMLASVWSEEQIVNLHMVQLMPLHPETLSCLSSSRLYDMPKNWLYDIKPDWFYLSATGLPKFFFSRRDR